MRHTAREPLEALAEDRPVVGAAVVDDRLGERREHLGRHRGRSRGEEVPLLGHLRLSLAITMDGRTVPSCHRDYRGDADDDR